MKIVFTLISNMHSKNYYFEDDIFSAQLEVTNAYHNEFLVFYYIINLL